jgi:hypothetical protein
VDRRVLQVALLCAACAQRAAPADAPPGREPALAPERAETAPPDAALEEPAAPAPPLEVLSGPAAESVIAETTGAREPAAVPPGAPELLITPRGVGRFVLGMSRREVLTALGRRGRLHKLWTPPGEVSVETGTLLSAGAPLLRFRIYGGRLTEITVVARDPRARTDHDIGVGSTFDEAVLAHGDARRSGPGFVLEDVPGVLFIPATPVAGPTPPPTTYIGSVRVVGPEAD